MAKVFEHITTSDHIRFGPFTHTAFSKGDLAAIGGITGTVDINSAENDAVEIDCGVPLAVFRTAEADVAGTVLVGSNVYITSAGALTMTDSGNTLFGVITDTAGAVSFVKVGA